MTRLGVGLVLACVLGLTACTGTDSDRGGDDQGAVRALSKALQVREGRLTSLPRLTSAEADCVATGLVESPGADALVRYGVLDEDLRIKESRKPLSIPQDTAVEMTDVITRCVDLAEKQRDDLGDSDDPPAVTRCFDRVMDEDGMRRILTSGLTGNSAGVRQVNRELRRCFVRSPTGSALGR